MLCLLRSGSLAILALGFIACGSTSPKPVAPTPVVRAPVRAPAPVRFATKTEDTSVKRDSFTPTPARTTARTTRDPDEVRRVIARRRGRIQGCYRRALAKDPAVAGKVVFRWRVARSGVVTGTRIVQSTVGHRGLERCVKQQVAQLRFGQVRRGPADEIVFPFVFSPDQGR